MNYRKFIPRWAIVNAVNYTSRAKTLMKLFDSEDYRNIRKEVSELLYHIPRLAQSIRPIRDMCTGILKVCAAMAEFTEPSFNAVPVGVHYVICQPYTEYSDLWQKAQCITVVQDAADTAGLALRTARGGMVLPENLRFLAADIYSPAEIQSVKNTKLCSTDTPLYINLGFVPVTESRSKFLSVIDSLGTILTSRDNLVFCYTNRTGVHPASPFARSEYTPFEMERLLAERGFHIYEEKIYDDKTTGCRMIFVLRVKSFRH